MTLLAATGDTFAHTVLAGPLLVAAPVALLAGLVSFLSPCVLPLVPGYLSTDPGLSGADLAAAPEPAHPRGGDAGAVGRAVGTAVGAAVGTSAGTAVATVAPATPAAPVAPAVRRGRVLAGSSLFVLGFSAVFVSAGALFGGLGAALSVHAAVVTRVLGAVTIVLGLAFLGWLPGLQREWRVHRLPPGGLASAPLLGVLFGVGWTPCIGPTLGAVQTLAYDSASAGRGAFLTAVYCVGLGLPFVLSGLAFRRALGAFAVVRRHYRWVMRAGGALLVLLGALLVSGLWDALTVHLRALVSGFTPAV